MHIIIAVLGGLVTLLVLNNRLKQLGIDLGWLNPFSWAHRRRWRKKYGADPAFTLKSPMEVAAGLMYVAAKCSGDISLEEKQFILNVFETEFNLNNRQASDLLSSCTFLIKDEDTIFNKVPLFVEASLAESTPQQRQLTVDLVQRVIEVDANSSEKQLKFLDKVKAALIPNKQTDQQWR